MKSRFNLENEFKKSLDYILESKNFIYSIIGVFFFFFLIGFFLPTPEPIIEQIFKFIKELLEKTKDMSQGELIRFIFLNNLQASFFGIIFGVFCTTIVFFLIGDVEIETEFKFGEKSTQEDEKVKVNIEKEISYIDTIKVEDIKALSINGKEIISIETETITREKLIELLKVKGTSTEITFTPSDDSKEVKALVIE